MERERVKISEDHLREEKSGAISSIRYEALLLTHVNKKCDISTGIDKSTNRTKLKFQKQSHTYMRTWYMTEGILQ